MKFSNISSTFRKKNGQWNVDLEFIITFYDCYVRERSLRTVAAAMGMRETQLSLLLKKHPELDQARDMAEMNRNKSALKNYVLNTLSEDARLIWDKIANLSSLEAIEGILKNRPTKVRQQLFCHAILHTGYDISKACAMVGVNRNMIEKWKQDLEFLQMLEEVQFHKKNFFEKALIGLVSDGYPGAVIYANRTINRDRGYDEKITVESNIPIGRVDWDIGDLDLDVVTMKKVLAAIEKKKAESGEEGGNVLELASANGG